MAKSNLNYATVRINGMRYRINRYTWKDGSSSFIADVLGDDGYWRQVGKDRATRKEARNDISIHAGEEA